MKQRRKRVPAADVKEWEGNQRIFKSADQTGRENIERIPDHLPMRHNANFRHGGRAAGMDIQTNILHRQRNVHFTGNGFENDVFKNSLVIIDIDH